MHGCLVTGTDTGVGKTVLCAALVAALRAAGEDAGAHKPVVTGLEKPAGRWPHDHELLAALAGMRPEHVAPHRYGPAASPHLAAALAGEQLERADLVAEARAAGERHRPLIVEGVGGLLVPLAADCSVADLAGELGLPLLIAARPGLGTINHTLLTVDSARARGLDVRAVVLTPWPAAAARAPDPIERSNRETIERLAEVEVAVLEEVAEPRAELLAIAGGRLPYARWLATPSHDEPPAGVRLDHVVIAVSDWERSNSFYRRVVGATPVREGDPRRWCYRLGDQQLNVHGPGVRPEPVARIPAAPGMADLCLRWPGPIESAVEHLLACDVAVERGPVPRLGPRGGALSVYFRDPDGSLLEFISYGRGPQGSDRSRR